MNIDQCIRKVCGMIGRVSVDYNTLSCEDHDGEMVPCVGFNVQSTDGQNTDLLLILMLKKGSIIVDENGNTVARLDMVRSLEDLTKLK
jgi:hypothetical protein